jgi:hypothetical protein
MKKVSENICELLKNTYLCPLKKVKIRRNESRDTPKKL